MNTTFSRSKTPTGYWGEEQKELDAQLAEASVTFPGLSTKDLAKLQTTTKRNTTTITIKESFEQPLLITTDVVNTKHTLLFEIAKNVNVHIVETVSGDAAKHEVYVRCEENSSVVYAMLQTATQYYGEKTAVLAQNASLQWVDVATKKSTIKNYTTLAGKNSHTESNALFIGGSAAKIELYAGALHEGEETTSYLRARGVLKGTSAICEGELTLNGAKADAHQDAKCLLLDDVASAKLSPRLFINNHDVTCSHATSAMQLDEDMLFYLQSKGIAQQEAQELMVIAFLWVLVEKIPQDIQKIITPIIQQSLEDLQ